jgi:uncharacterized protein YoxC|tara:strand:+ start:9996 stop:10286 length:291 start_codon:yes stop_codon:yes gene_type:complete
MKPHAQWRTNIERRTESLTGDWWPFVENTKEILDKMDEIMHEFNMLENKVDETMGMVKGLYKSLHKVGLFDKELKLNWKAVEIIQEVINAGTKEEE